MNFREKLEKEIMKFDDDYLIAFMRRAALIASALFSAFLSAGSMPKKTEEAIVNTEMTRANVKIVECDIPLYQTKERYSIDFFKQLKQDCENIKMEKERILNLSNEEKIEKILERFDLTDYELNVIIACVIAEAGPTSYEEAYNVINTIYNRTICSRWVRSHGSNLYSQCTAPGQFVVFENGSYKMYLNVDESYKGRQAVIDFLFTLNLSHDCLSFRSKDSSVEGSVQFTPHGNRYFDHLKAEERLEEEVSIEVTLEQEAQEVVLKYMKD